MWGQSATASLLAIARSPALGTTFVLRLARNLGFLSDPSSRDAICYEEVPRYSPRQKWVQPRNECVLAHSCARMSLSCPANHTSGRGPEKRHSGSKPLRAGMQSVHAHSRGKGGRKMLDVWVDGSSTRLSPVNRGGYIGAGRCSRQFALLRQRFDFVGQPRGTDRVRRGTCDDQETRRWA